MYEVIRSTVALLGAGEVAGAGQVVDLLAVTGHQSPLLCVHTITVAIGLQRRHRIDLRGYGMGEEQQPVVVLEGLLHACHLGAHLRADGAARGEEEIREHHLAFRIFQGHRVAVLVDEAEGLDVVYAVALTDTRIHQTGIELGRVIDRQAIVLADHEHADDDGDGEERCKDDKADNDRALAHHFKLRS